MDRFVAGPSWHRRVMVGGALRQGAEGENRLRARVGELLGRVAVEGERTILPRDRVRTEASTRL